MEVVQASIFQDERDFVTCKKTGHKLGGGFKCFYFHPEQWKDIVPKE